MKNIINKLTKLFLIAGLIVSLINLNVYALTDPETGMEYSVSYSTSVNIYGAANVQLAGNDIYSPVMEFWDDAFYQKYQVGLFDEQVQEDIKKHTDILVDATTSYKPYTKHTICVSQNGRFSAIDKSEEAIYLQFFGLPLDFMGEKVIEKEGLAFGIIRDSISGLKVAVNSEEKGNHKKEFIISPEISYEIIERSNYYKCTVHYSIPNSATLTRPQNKTATYKAYNLEDAIDYCRNYASFTDEIAIYVRQEVVKQVISRVPYEIKLEFYYGITDNNIQDKTDTTNSEESPTNASKDDHNKLPTITEQDRGENEKLSTEVVSSEIEKEQPEEILTNEKIKEHVEQKENETTREAAVVFDQKQDDRKTVRTVKVVVITLSVVLAVALIGGGFLCVQKRQTRTNK